MLAEGHPHARAYPLGTLWEEARIARRRHAERATTDAVLVHAAVLAMWSKEGAAHFRDVLEEVNRADG